MREDIFAKKKEKEKNIGSCVLSHAELRVIHEFITNGPKDYRLALIQIEYFLTKSSQFAL